MLVHLFFLVNFLPSNPGLLELKHFMTGRFAWFTNETADNFENPFQIKQQMRSNKIDGDAC